MENYILQAIDILRDNILLTLIFMFISAVLQTIFPPYPGDVIIALSGFISSQLHIFNSEIISLLIGSLVIFSGTFLSSILVFNIGYSKGKKILKNKFFIKYFPLKNYDKIKFRVDKFGTFSILISKFIPGIYTIVVLTCGIFKHDKLTSYISIGIVTIIHNGMLIFIGRKIGNNVDKIKYILASYNEYLIILLIALLFSIILYNIFTWKKNKIGGCQ